VYGGMIGETPYDLRWTMFGIPVRVHPLFWVMAAFISWPLLEAGLLFVIAGMLAIFLSILWHELGHIFMGRLFNARGEIVLWAFGGLAIGASTQSNRWKRIAVYLAGPGAQLLLWGALRLAVPHIPLPVNPHTAHVLFTFLDFMLLINLYWAILNLLPIYPLDGGQITRDLFTHFSERNGVRYSLQLSIGVSGLLALHAFLAEKADRALPYLPVGVSSGIFFLVFCLFGVQLLQFANARDRWTDEHRWD